VFAPVRDKAFKRQEELEFLQERKLPVPPHGAAYSINRGLWGVTIGGKETLTSRTGSIPDDAWVLSKDAFTKPRAPEKHTIHFDKGRPVGLDGKTMTPVEVIEQLETDRGPFGIGRGIHLGDTIIGTKGRVAFEAPAAEMLLNAHRELEKLVLTGRQQRIKESWPARMATGCTKASCSTRSAATSRRCCCRRRSASPASCTCCCGRAAASSRASNRRTR
jgi:argininosuccinate synthase